MQSSSEKYVTVHERLEKIERQNQRLKRGMGLLSLALFGLLLMGAKAGLNDGQFRQLTVEGIKVVDSAGRETILIGSGESGTGMRILNKAGNRVVGIGITPDERGSGMLVADKEGRPRFGFGMDKGLPSLAMTDENGKKIMALGGDAKGYGLVIMDGNEVERAGIGFKNGNTAIVLYDDKGEYARGMIRLANGASFSSYVNENGQEVIMK